MLDETAMFWKVYSALTLGKCPIGKDGLFSMWAKSGATSIFEFVAFVISFGTKTIFVSVPVCLSTVFLII